MRTRLVLMVICALGFVGCDSGSRCTARVWEVEAAGRSSECGSARAEVREIGGKVYGVCTCDAAPDAGRPVERGAP